MSRQDTIKTAYWDRLLRQGWGYDNRLNLHNLHAKVSANIPLDSQEQKAWDRCHAMLLYIQEDDLVAVKNVHSRDKFTIARVIGKYDFQIDSSVEDYGHLNMNDADSLEQPIREEHTPTSLPVITLGRVDRLRERAYRERCVVRLMEIGLEIAPYLGTGRLCIP